MRPIARAECSPRYAVVLITKCSAVIYGPHGIRINAVAPGATPTNIQATFASEMAQTRLGPLLDAKVTAPTQGTQVAASITFLHSDDGTNINGGVLTSDGGWSQSEAGQSWSACPTPAVIIAPAPR